MQFYSRRLHPAGDIDAFGLDDRLRRLGVFAVRDQTRRRRGQRGVRPDSRVRGARSRNELNREYPIVVVQQFGERLPRSPLDALVRAERDDFGEALVVGRQPPVCFWRRPPRACRRAGFASVDL